MALLIGLNENVPIWLFLLSKLCTKVYKRLILDGLLLLIKVQ